MPEFTLKLVSAEENEKKRCCCNCGNNIRYENSRGNIECKCAIDGHHIGYVQCFECWCRRWRKERKWEKD